MAIAKKTSKKAEAKETPVRAKLVAAPDVAEESAVASEPKKPAVKRAPSRAKTQGQAPKLDPSAVAHRAWEIWQREGCPEGRDMEHWLQAEQDLLVQD